MTLHWIELILIVAIVGAGIAAGYWVLLRKMHQIVQERHLKIADQLASLDDAIRALETRLTEHHAALELIEGADSFGSGSEGEIRADAAGSEAVSPEMRAVIASAAVTALGGDIHIRSMKPATSSWSQQGRVLVQSSHNARARR